MVYEQIGQALPQRIRAEYTQLLRYAGIDMDSRRLLGMLLSMGAAIGVAAALYLRVVFNLEPLTGFFFVFGLLQLIAYLVLSFAADSRASHVEQVLPDALQLMSANMKVGLTTDKALILAARPEFGAFESAVRTAGKEMMTGKDFDQALRGMANTIKSDTLLRTIELITQGTKSGGELALLLEQTAEDLRAQSSVKKEIQANVMTYAGFIVLAAGFGAPLLFAMSGYLAKVLVKFISTFAGAGVRTQGIPLSISGTTLNPEYVFYFALVSITLSSITGSMIVGAIQRGSEKEGLKLVPVMLAISLGVFFVAKFLVETMFKSMMAF